MLDRNVCPVKQTPGEAAAKLAGQQRGSVKRSQLLAAGVSRHTVDRRANNGDLHRVHCGVYLVGHTALAPGAQEQAALLACGANTVISHGSAAHLWSLVDVPPDLVHITLVGRRCRPKEGVKLHCVTAIDQRDLRRKGRLVLTAPARTVIDLAAETPGARLERAIGQARVSGLLREGELEAALDRAGARAGVGIVRALLAREGALSPTRSDLERRMLKLMRAARLARPSANARVAGLEVDFLWPAQRLVVEVDGYRFHGHRMAFERDRRKDLALAAAGYRVIRISWRQLEEEQLAVVATVAGVLGQYQSTSGGRDQTSGGRDQTSRAPDQVRGGRGTD